jgi:hypothetical protein
VAAAPASARSRAPIVAASDEDDRGPFRGASGAAARSRLRDPFFDEVVRPSQRAASDASIFDEVTPLVSIGEGDVLEGLEDDDGSAFDGAEGTLGDDPKTDRGTDGFDTEDRD